jgi:hypothetical protein
MSSEYTFLCEKCNKYYKSKQSLSNHKSRYHKPKVSISVPKSQPKVSISVPKSQPKVSIVHFNKVSEDKQIFNCNFCEKKFAHKQSKYRHEKNCKNNIDINQLREEHRKEIQELKDQLFEILNKTYKMHPKTLQKINKQLLQKQDNSNNNGTINNGTINITNNYIVQLGNENLLETLSKKEQIMILDKKHQSLNHIVEYIHFNNEKFPQFQNIAITNMKDNIAHMYNEDKNQFIAMNKDELLNTVIEMRMLDIEDFYANNIENLNEKTKTNIKNFIDKMYNDDKYFDYKKNDIKLVLYNNSDTNMIKN